MTNLAMFLQKQPLHDNFAVHYYIFSFRALCVARVRTLKISESGMSELLGYFYILGYLYILHYIFFVVDKVARANNRDSTNAESNPSTSRERNACIYMRENHQ